MKACEMLIMKKEVYEKVRLTHTEVYENLKALAVERNKLY